VHEQLDEHRRIGDIVDRDPLHLRPAFVCGTKRRPAGAAEPVELADDTSRKMTLPSRTPRAPV
jgi:hypothetical protein